MPWHGTLSGPATRVLLERALRVYGDSRFEHLATISVAHLYNLRKLMAYPSVCRHWTKTRPSPVSIGIRCSGWRYYMTCDLDRICSADWLTPAMWRSCH